LAFRWPLPGVSPLQFSESAQPERWGEVRELLDQHVPGVQALVYRPITHQRQVKALMVLLMNHSTPLGNRQIRWLKTFGDELSFALVHREQGQEMERRTLRVLRQMVDIFESGSDPWSFRSERVSSLAGRLALRLGLSEYEQQELRELAYLYSLGRLVQPTELKNSPDQLQHALLGSRILESVPHLAHLAPSLRHFGEHWDGSGFPDGLAGIQIPLYSRIIGLAQACESGRRPELPSGRLVETLSKTGYYDPSLCTLLKDMVEADEIKV
jgi:response regulator RpfG family c-di-GMP phosphodiesterase